MRRNSRRFSDNNFMNFLFRHSLMHKIQSMKQTFFRFCKQKKYFIKLMIKEGKQKIPEKKTKNRTYLGHLSGPIFFTAPHSKKLWRGGERYNEKKRIHNRELYTSWLCMRLAQLTSLSSKSINSFMVWGESQKAGNDYDPNYLLQDDFHLSQFHLALHAWALKNEGVPLLHIDIHGKKNRADNVEVDVGLAPMKYHWEGDDIISFFEPFFEKEMTKIFKGMKFRNMKGRFETNPSLHGLWGGGKHTMTEQAILLGIPSFQLQIPFQIRNKFVDCPQLLDQFAQGLSYFYSKIITPYYAKKTIPLTISKQLALKFQKNVTKKEVDELLVSMNKFDEKNLRDPKTKDF